MEATKYDDLSDTFISKIQLLSELTSNLTSNIFPITTDEKHNLALKCLDELIQADDESSIFTDLICSFASKIEEYEDNLDGIKDFVASSNRIHTDISITRTIIDQNNLLYSDLPEIGDKAAVSKVLSGKKKLTREHIDKLCARFSLNPAIFFNQP
ncbi:MAG: transcriptional regulator [Pseudomonadota bacterium]|nr:transcriptional regulator [Pseudomonadota bacterium]